MGSFCFCYLLLGGFSAIIVPPVATLYGALLMKSPRFILILAFIGGLFGLFLSPAALAQDTGTRGTVLAACAGANYATAVGQLRVITLGPDGTLCVSSVAVTGTVTTNQGTAGTSAWSMKIDQTTSGTTNGVVVNSSALPSGSATAVNQHSTAAGTSDTSAQGIQGVTNGVPVPVSGSTGGTSIVLLRGSISGQALGYTVGSSIGGLITLSGLEAGKSYVFQNFLLIVSATAYTTAGQIQYVVFDANPTASTFTDNTAQVIAPADNSKIVWLSANTAGTPYVGTGPVIYRSTGSNMGFKADAGGNAYLAIVSAVANVFVGASYIYNVDLRKQ